LPLSSARRADAGRIHHPPAGAAPIASGAIGFPCAHRPAVAHEETREQDLRFQVDARQVVPGVQEGSSGTAHHGAVEVATHLADGVGDGGAVVAELRAEPQAVAQDLHAQAGGDGLDVRIVEEELEIARPEDPAFAPVGVGGVREVPVEPRPLLRRSLIEASRVV
jgi:hypothetical protein